PLPTDAADHTLGPQGRRRARQPEALSQVDHRDDVISYVDDALDEGRRVWNPGQLRRLDDLVHPPKVHRILFCANAKGAQLNRLVLLQRLLGLRFWGKARLAHSKALWTSRRMTSSLPRWAKPRREAPPPMPGASGSMIDGFSRITSRTSSTRTPTSPSGSRTMRTRDELGMASSSASGPAIAARCWASLSFTLTS